MGQIISSYSSETPTTQTISQPKILEESLDQPLTDSVEAEKENIGITQENLDNPENLAEEANLENPKGDSNSVEAEKTLENPQGDSNSVMAEEALKNPQGDSNSRKPEGDSNSVKAEEVLKNPEGDSNLEGEEEGECGFCLYMKGGGCKDNFVAWEKCIQDADKNEEDIVDKCFEVTAALRICMEAHPDYYGPILLAEEAAEAAVTAELEKEKQEENVKEVVQTEAGANEEVLEKEKDDAQALKKIS